MVLISHCRDNWGGGLWKPFYTNSLFNLWFTFITSSVATLIVWNRQEGLQLLHLVCGLHAQRHTSAQPWRPADAHTQSQTCTEIHLSDSWQKMMKNTYSGTSKCTFSSSLHTCTHTCTQTHTHTHTMTIPWFYPNDWGKGERGELIHKRQTEESSRDREDCWLFSLSILSLADGSSIM